MVVVGVTVGRLRAAYTLIRRPRITVPSDVKSRPVIPEREVLTRLVPLQSISTEAHPDTIVDAIRTSVESSYSIDTCTTPEYNDLFCGLLDPPPLTSPEQWSRGTSLALIRLHAIVAHELRRQFRVPVNHISIGTARMSLGIAEGSAGDAKRGMVAQFKETVVDRDESSTGSGFQTMAESWAVATALERTRLISELRNSFPDLVQRARNEVNHRKLFQKSDVNKLKDSVMSDLVEAEVDKLLIKRFSL